MANMKTSQDGIDIIKKFEGFRANAYSCPAGVLTIGYGTTSGVKSGETVTEAQAEEMLCNDVKKFEDAVNDLVTVPLNQKQFDALVSLTYNIGEGALAKSTLVKKLNAGDYKGAADEFDKWNKGGGKVLEGLVKRRDSEQALFLSDPSVAMDNDQVRTASAAAATVGMTLPSFESFEPIINELKANGANDVAAQLEGIRELFNPTRINESLPKADVQKIADAMQALQDYNESIYSAQNIDRSVNPEADTMGMHLGANSYATLFSAINEPNTKISAITETINGKQTKVDEASFNAFILEAKAAGVAVTAADGSELNYTNATVGQAQAVMDAYYAKVKEQAIAEAQSQETSQKNDFFAAISQAMGPGFAQAAVLIIGLLSSMFNTQESSQKAKTGDELSQQQGTESSLPNDVQQQARAAISGNTLEESQSGGVDNDNLGQMPPPAKNSVQSDRLEALAR